MVDVVGFTYFTSFNSSVLDSGENVPREVVIKARLELQFFCFRFIACCGGGA